MYLLYKSSGGLVKLSHEKNRLDSLYLVERYAKFVNRKFENGQMIVGKQRSSRSLKLK
jgi:hypothetical protein